MSKTLPLRTYFILHVGFMVFLKSQKNRSIDLKRRSNHSKFCFDTIFLVIVQIVMILLQTLHARHKCRKKIWIKVD